MDISILDSFDVGPIVDDSVIDFVVKDSVAGNSVFLRIWQSGPEKSSGQRQPSSPVLESRKQVAPFWQGL